MSDKVVRTNMFEKKRFAAQAERDQFDSANYMDQAVVKFGDCPIWAVLAKIQRTFADVKCRVSNEVINLVIRKTDGVTGLLENDGDYIAGVWEYTKGGTPVEMLAVQAVRREAPRAAKSADDPFLLRDVADMYLGLNSCLPDGIKTLIEAAIMEFATDYHLVFLDADPDENTGNIQLYTLDRSYLFDVQIDLAVLGSLFDS